MIKNKSLAKRYATSYQSRDKNGSTGSRVINFSGTDLEFYAPQEGRNRISIVPYTIKSDKHPLVKNKTLEVGDMDYVMDIWEHRGVGPGQSSVLCLKHTYGKPCPICEEAARLKKEGKDDEAKALKAKRRVYYNVFDPKDGKVKIFATSHYLFEKELIEEARDDEDGGYIDFADPEEGKEIRFRAVKESLSGQEYFEYKSFSFEDRDDLLPKNVLNRAVSFDELLEVPTYNQVEKLLYGADEDSDNDEEEVDEKPTPKKVKPEPVEEDEEEERALAPKKSKKVVEEDEAECDKDCSKCPFGHTFGKDRDKFDDCDECDVWGECYKA